jgi:hypothetical protein
MIPEGRMICPICESEVEIDRANITESIWNELSMVLFKYAIPYTTSYSTRSVGKPPIDIVDKHIQINLTIPDYYKDLEKNTK